jgi:hypothetical protein
MKTMVKAVMETVMKAMVPRLVAMAEFPVTRGRVIAGIAMIETRCLRGGHRQAQRRKDGNRQ